MYVYDTTVPETPKLLDSLPLFQTGAGAALAQEDPDTNGEILLVDAAPTPSASSSLQVVDVSDPRNLKVLSTVAVTDHTWTCISGVDARGEQNRCAFAYGRTGNIVDLRDPANAKKLDVTWRSSVGYGTTSNTPYTHDLTEIRPGLVMSAGADAILMDTSDPTAPIRLAAIEGKERFSSLGYHSVEWGRGGRDRYVVLGTEIAPDGPTNAAGSDCEGEESVIETWDASQVVRALRAYERTGNVGVFDEADFVRVDTFDVGGRGLFLDGQAPAHVLYCAHWMELHPRFQRGGLVTISYYDRGTRFVDVAKDGTMSEVGWITAAEGYSGSSQWISDEVVYIVDYRRGLEVVRLTGDAATAVVSDAPAAIAVGSGYVPPGALPFAHASTISLAAFGLLVLGIDRHRRRRIA